MSIKGYKLVAGVLAAATLAGCVNPERIGRTTTDDQYFWKRHYTVPIEMSPQNLNDEASEPKVERALRCQDIFYLFGAYIRPGYSSKQIGEVMRGAKWLDEARLDPVGGLGGWVPIFAGRNDTMFVLYVFPDNRGVSDWSIYFTLSQFESRTVEEERRKVLVFFKGTLPDKGVRLREFALCYPQCKIERFTKRGVGLMVLHEDYRPATDNQQNKSDPKLSK